MMKLMTMKQYMKMSKPALIRKITKTLRAMPKVKLARLCYNMTKSKLPRLRTTRKLPMLSRRKLAKAKTLKAKLLYLGEKVPDDVQRLIDAEGPKFTMTHKKFSRKQLAAQRLFAKRARAGTLKRRRR